MKKMKLAKTSIIFMFVLMVTVAFLAVQLQWNTSIRAMW